MDDAVDAHSLADSCFIKADTEGYECKVLSGATRTLLHCVPELPLEISPENKAEATAPLTHLGYRLVFHYGKNYHYSKTLSPAALFLLAFEALSIDLRVASRKTSSNSGRYFCQRTEARENGRGSSNCSCQPIGWKIAL